MSACTDKCTDQLCVCPPASWVPKSGEKFITADNAMVVVQHVESEVHNTPPVVVFQKGSEVLRVPATKWCKVLLGELYA